VEKLNTNDKAAEAGGLNQRENALLAKEVWMTSLDKTSNLGGGSGRRFM
jgi:hypothetical protein